MVTLFFYINLITSSAFVRSPMPFKITSSNHNYKNLSEDMLNLTVNTVPADDLARSGARTSTGTVLAN